ncbi:Di-copper centre-containing protein [Tothia fuscella]|uniref:tyrosinase n=1 Tax=Tothia fuscella TaxID=1048955 RepID=A0A9P4U489_9PEZI|nr:Di-copper centre-containing protein [Tothia fuscella]
MQRTGGPAWDLYLLSLQAFQQKNQTEMFSWFQFSGIHGYPEVNWDGVESVANHQVVGYAPHSAILFGPWHRLYLAAYEQIISQLAQDIAAQYPANQLAKYQAAATTLRIPYWDWANSAALPACLSTPTITVNSPRGRTSFDNPLASYLFHPVPNDGSFPPGWDVSSLPKTSRLPDGNGNSRTSELNRVLAANQAGLRDNLYYLIARQTRYGPFSNNGFPIDQRNGQMDSIENIHNTIHGLVGGHMNYVVISAYDPLFFLHHTNIDRIFSIWSAINPKSYVVPQKNSGGTYAQAPGSVEDIHTPLKPFHSDANGSFHTSTTARDTMTFGYSYPEVVDWNVTPNQLASNVRSIVNTLYAPAGSLAKRSVSRIMRRADAQVRDWFVNFSVKRTVLAPVSVHFFMGEPPAQPENWSTASNLIISQMILPDLTPDNLGAPALAQIPLTRSLINAQKNNQLKSTSVASVSSFLKTQLQWRVQTTTGEVLDAKTLTDFKISVVDQVVQETTPVDLFNQYGQFNEHPELQWGN